MPYGINDWINIGDSVFTYPQPWWFEGKGFLHTYTRHTAGRELYVRSSRDGVTWNAEKKLAGMQGHYQTSHQVGAYALLAHAHRYLAGVLSGGAEISVTCKRRLSWAEPDST